MGVGVWKLGGVFRGGTGGGCVRACVCVCTSVCMLQGLSCWAAVVIACINCNFVIMSKIMV